MYKRCLAAAAVLHLLVPGAAAAIGVAVLPMKKEETQACSSVTFLSVFTPMYVSCIPLRGREEESSLTSPSLILQALKDDFAQHGDVRDVYIPKDFNTG